MTGYHIYYQTKEDGEFEALNYLAQLASIKFWKKYYGSIKLYCNQRYLESISKYGLDEEYDEIDTQFLETIPYQEYADRYWSFCKIYLANKIAQEETSFCILDTDIWISKPNLISNKEDVVFYHKEDFREDYKMNPYPDPINWIEDVNYNWDIYPRNCAIICFNSNFKELIAKWLEVSIQVIEQTHSKQFSFENKNSSTIFIEQRLLPVLIDKLGLTMGEVFPSVYQSDKDGFDGHEWVPRIDSSEYLTYLASVIKHIWGVKRYYDQAVVRRLAIDICFEALNRYGEFEPRYEKLFTECEKIYKIN
jgi:hypothetical protein